MMIVIAIILMLLGLVFFPYNYYMQRAYVENTVDTIGQWWILAHKDIRNGKLYTTGATAHKVLVFQKGNTEIQQYLLTGTTLPNLSTISTDSAYKAENPIRFESSVGILGFSGAWLDDSDTVGYFIEAPSGSWAFFTGTTLISSTGVLLRIGYEGAELSSGRARQILLRTYLQ